VTLTTGFFLGVHPVTQAQWHAVTGRNPSEFKGGDLPVERLSWDDCQRFVAELTRRTGVRFRLPTEAEWECACRAGTTTAFFFGETASVDRANYDGSYACGSGGVKGVFRETTTPAGNFPPNAWGLYDMHGNVREWCEDWSNIYPSGEVRDPQGGDHGHARVVRGGSWYDEPRHCRSACRSAYVPGYGDDCFGCRVLRGLD
jgi:formylglycine-generating enzyme required for sulfatase activity